LDRFYKTIILCRLLSAGPESNAVLFLHVFAGNTRPYYEVLESNAVLFLHVFAGNMGPYYEVFESNAVLFMPAASGKGWYKLFRTKLKRFLLLF